MDIFQHRGAIMVYNTSKELNQLIIQILTNLKYITKQIKIIQIKIQMFANNVYTFKNLPVEDKLRKRTDCFCTICSSLFALVLFILSFVFFKKQNYYEANFPTDDAGKTCAYDYPNNIYVYFANPNDMSSGRYCVSACPSVGEPLQCAQDAQAKCVAFGASQYSTEGVINRLGAFCIAKNQTVANHMWSQPQVQVKSSILNSIDTILLSLLLGLCLGILYMGLTACCPKLMIRLVFIGTFLILMFAGIFMLVKPVQLFNNNIWNILLAVLFIITAIVFLVYMLCYNLQLKLAQIFMQNGNKFLKSDPLVFLYIPLFLVLTVGLITLIVWQYIAFGTANETYLRPGDIYRSSSHSIPLQILNALELIWGLQFLRDAFNYVVSGNAVQWYFRNQDNNYKSHCCKPCNRFMCKNWGSVAGGSFLNAFFGIFDIFSDIFRCDPRGPCGKCQSIYRKCCCCDYIFELIRTDAYSYINLTGIPYCNAARQCQALCHYSDNFRSSQSCLRLYRIAAHIFLTALTAIICYFILAAKGAQYTNWFIIALIVFGAYCISTYFIDIHANAAEGLMVSYLTEHNCDGELMEVCPPGLKEDMYHYNYDQKK